MPNPFEKIAEKEKQKALAKQNADAERFAKKVADQVTSNINDLSLNESIATLAHSVAEAIVLSNKSFDESLRDNFTQLLSAVKENKPDASQIELSLKIGEQLAALEGMFNTLDVTPTVNVNGISVDDLRAEVAKILDRLPVDNQRLVTLSYENAMPDKFITVRLSDGINWYKAGGIGGGGAAIPEGLATAAKQDDIIDAINGISGTTNKTTRIATVGSITYIGNAAMGADAAAAVWQIKRLDATSGLIKLWADGNDNFDNVWNDRASLSYS